MTTSKMPILGIVISLSVLWIYYIWLHDDILNNLKLQLSVAGMMICIFSTFTLPFNNKYNESIDAKLASLGGLVLFNGTSFLFFFISSFLITDENSKLLNTLLILGTVIYIIGLILTSITKDFFKSQD